MDQAYLKAVWVQPIHIPIYQTFSLLPKITYLVHICHRNRISNHIRKMWHRDDITVPVLKIIATIAIIHFGQLVPDLPNPNRQPIAIRAT